MDLPMHYTAAGQGMANARALRQQQTDVEKLVWEIVRGSRLDQLKFRRQHPVGPFIADFYCHTYRLVIELDGAVHDEAEQQAYDQHRDSWMAEQGLTVLRFTNDEVTNNIEAVVRRIREAVASPLHLTPSPSPAERGAASE